MKIKKRTIRAPVSEEFVKNMIMKDVMAKPVNFAAFESKPKEPMPDPAIMPMHGDNPKPARIRRTGLIAQRCGFANPDEGMNVADKLILMRTPYDPNNPQEARYRNRVRNRATAITAMCITCTGGRKEVTECADVTCPLWAFRLGGNPFRRRK